MVFRWVFIKRGLHLLVDWSLFLVFLIGVYFPLNVKEISCPEEFLWENTGKDLRFALQKIFNKTILFNFNGWNIASPFEVHSFLICDAFIRGNKHHCWWIDSLVIPHQWTFAIRQDCMIYITHILSVVWELALNRRVSLVLVAALSGRRNIPLLHLENIFFKIIRFIMVKLI